MFDKEKFTPEFYDKLSDSEKKELVQVMLEDQLTDPLHIKGLPKPVQNCIKKAVRSSAKNMKEETIAGYPVEWINGIKSKDETEEKTLNVWDKPYPVMTPKDEKMMRGMSDEIKEKFQEYVESNTGIPHETITIDSTPEDVGEEVKPINRAPIWVKRYLETEHWIDGIRDSEIDVLTGCTQNFKLQRKIDMLEAYEDDIRKFLGMPQSRMIPISDRAEISPPDQDEMRRSITRVPVHTYDWAIAPSHRADRMGRIWLDSMPKLCEYIGMSKEEYLNWLYDSTRKHGYQPNTLYIRPRAFGRIYKSALWMKLLGMDAQSYSIDEFPAPPKPITTVQLYDVIHWNRVHVNYTFGLKAKDCRARHALEELVGYNDLSPISRMIFDSLKVCGPEMLKQGKLVGPNFNEDKKRLERTIEKRRKKK